MEREGCYVRRAPIGIIDNQYITRPHPFGKLRAGSSTTGRAF